VTSSRSPGPSSTTRIVSVAEAADSSRVPPPGMGGEFHPPPTPMLRSLDLVAMTRVVPMGFGNARHGCKSTEEHEREDDDSLHLDLTPSISIAYEVSHRLRGRQPLYGRMRRRSLARTHKFASWANLAVAFGLRAIEETSTVRAIVCEKRNRPGSSASAQLDPVPRSA
jgi:hypothetical protein